MKLCMVGGPRCVVILVKCDPNRSRGHSGVGVEIGPSLLLWPVAYTTACTTVQAVIVYRSHVISCYRVPKDNPRITCVFCQYSHVPDLIISSIYMTWSDRSSDHIMEYKKCTDCLQGIVDKHIGCQFIFGGDFNAAKDSDTYLEFTC